MDWRDEIDGHITEVVRKNSTLANKRLAPDEAIGKSTFTKKDLGIKDYRVVEPARDGGYAEDINKAVKKVTIPGFKREKPTRFLAQTLGKSYLYYAKLRKKMGLTIESPVLRYWNMPYHKQIMGLINPGGIVHIKEGAYNVSTTILPKNDVWVRGEGFATSLKGTTSLGTTAVMGDPNEFSASTPLTNFKMSDFQIDGTNMDHVSSYLTTRKGVDIHHLRRAVAVDLYIHDTPATGFGCDYFDGGLIQRLQVDDCGTSTTLGSNGIGIATDAFSPEPCVISDCIAQNNANRQIKYEGLNNGNAGPYVIGNSIAIGGQAGFGISLSTQGAIVNCHAMDGNDDTDAHHFSISAIGGQGDDILVSGCTSYNSGKYSFMALNSANDRISFVGNTVFNSGAGAFYGLGNNMIWTGNRVYGAQKAGIYFEPPNNTGPIEGPIITNNLVMNCGQEGTAGELDGIRVRDTFNEAITGGLVTGNICRDNQGTPTQDYGIRIGDGTITGLIVANNILRGNKTGALRLDDNSVLTDVEIYANDLTGGFTIGTGLTNTRVFIHNNRGYITESVGTGTIANAATSSGNIAHGLSYTPLASEIRIMFTENPTNTPGSWWASGIDATNFVINVENDPGASGLDFGWSIQRVSAVP